MSESRGGGTYDRLFSPALPTKCNEEPPGLLCRYPDAASISCSSTGRGGSARPSLPKYTISPESNLSLFWLPRGIELYVYAKAGATAASRRNGAAGSWLDVCSG